MKPFTLRNISEDQGCIIEDTILQGPSPHGSMSVLTTSLSDMLISLVIGSQEAPNRLSQRGFLAGITDPR